MMQFRLLDLPIVVLRRFVAISGINPVIFAMCNSKCHKLLKEAKLKACYIHGFRARDTQIVCQLQNECSFVWIIDPISQLNGREPNYHKNTIEGHSFWIPNEGQPDGRVVYSEDVHRTFEIITNIIKTLFNYPFDFFLSVSTIPNFREFYLRHVVNGNSGEITICEDADDSETIPGDILQFILDVTPSHCSLDITSPPADDFRYNKKLKTFSSLTVTIPDGDWRTYFPFSQD